MTNGSFLGLGAAGSLMASRILSAGFPPTVRNRSREKGRGLVERGARRAESPREAAVFGEAGFADEDFTHPINHRLGRGAPGRS